MIELIAHILAGIWGFGAFATMWAQLSLDVDFPFPASIGAVLVPFIIPFILPILIGREVKRQLRLRKEKENDNKG